MNTQSKVPVFSIEEQEEFDRLLQEKDMCNIALFLNYHINEEASLETMVKGVQQYMPYMRLSLQEEDINTLLRVLGDTSILGLDLEHAFSYFKEAEDTERIQQTRHLALLYGKRKTVQHIQEHATKKSIPELTLSDGAYKEFFRSKALPCIKLHRDEKGFFIEEKDIEEILSEIQLSPSQTKEALFKEALEELEHQGSRNIPKQYLFALLTQDPDIITRHEKRYQQAQQGPRPSCQRKLEEHLGDEGKIIRTLQNGDKDNFFPTSGNIFLVEEEGKKYVAKEHLKQYTDFSRMNGYSMEKEIMEALSKRPQHPGIPRYLGTINAGGIEFLNIEFIRGEPLRRFVKQRLPREKITDILIQTASTIEYLHSQHILYGDVKDKNVIYDGTKATLIDFGMSRRFDEPITDETFYYSTASTPKYTTPERVLTHKVYARSDVFQLGILAYELLTGTHPFARYKFKEGKSNRESALIKYGLSNLHNAFMPAPDIQKNTKQ